MKIINRLIALCLILSLLLTLPITAAAADRNAAEAAQGVVGDVDGDGAVTIDDVSVLQAHFAEIMTLSDSAVILGDADLSDDTDVNDVTVLQRFLAHFSGTFYVDLPLDQAKKQKKDDGIADQYREILDAIENFDRAKGVDISEFNGDVDMNKLKAAGYTFVIIRLGYGDDETNQDDSLFETNVRKAEAAGLDWGAYIYSYALTEREAKSEVAHTLRLLKGKHPTMPIAFDWEDDSYKQRNGMPSDENVRKIAYTYLSGIEAAGYYPILYTGYDWLMGAFNHPDIDKYDVWLAQWSATYDYTRRPLGMWQYGGEQNFLEPTAVEGLSGSFDKDFSYKNYPMIVKAYGYNNHTALLPSSLASTSASYESDDDYEGENLPPECNGVMGDSLRSR